MCSCTAFNAPCSFASSAGSQSLPAQKACKRRSRRGFSASFSAGRVTVALTREKGKNGALREAIAAVNSEISCVELPCVETVEGPDRNALVETLCSQIWSWIVVTSPEAAAVFCDAWLKTGKPSFPVAAVGSATAAVLETAGAQVRFVPEKATGRALVNEMPPAKLEGEAVLYPASALASMDIVEGLGQKGYRVERLNTYSTEVAHWDSSQRGEADFVDIVAFAAPSAVKGWVHNKGVDKSLTVACIGETSRAAACNVGFLEENVFYAEKPGITGWVGAVSNAVDHVKRRVT